MRKRNHFKLKKAFTLIEISVVVLIIGIMIAGTFIGSRLVAKSRLAAAESLARSSPVPGIKDNMLWLETSLSASIDSSQANDGRAVTSWYDQSSNSNKPLVVAVGSGPTYANTINYVHAIKFDGSTANYLQVSDASFLNNTDYTIMVLEKRQSATAGYFIGETSGSANTSLALGYASDSTIVHTQGNQSYATSATVSSYASSTDKPRQFTFVHSSTAGNSTYINGILAAQDATKTSHLTGITSLAIGKGYTGEIGEIAIFARALASSDRQTVEDYASKKWSRSNNRSAVPNGSCVGYTITETGCDLSASPCSINIAGLVASVSPTSTSTSIACNQANYAGSVNYTCVNGVASTTGSCTATPPCNSVSVTGVSSPVTLASGTNSSSTCNASHYTGTAAYSCSSGTLTVNTACTCATGYTGSGCSTCNTGYFSDGSGGCDLKCTITGVTGITDGTKVNPGTTSIACNTSGASGGPITYTCTGGTFTKTGGTCTVPKCTGGNTTMYTVPGERIHVFTSNDTLICNQTFTAQVLIVAGGGGGGGNIGGGGGAGGLIYQTSQSLSSGSYPILVGTGGAGGNSGVTGANGGNSSFNGQIALGGGGGGGWGSTAASGGSGGGSGGSGSGATGQSGQGKAGGSPGTGYVGGGGGGAGHDGYNGSSVGGNGGEGLSNPISGSNLPYAAGGGGGTVNAGNNSGGTGGSTIGGNGGSANQVKTNGAAYTGSGGGGGGNIDPRTGGNGGSGIVIIRYVN